MPVYTYRAKQGSTELVDGAIEAESLQLALLQLDRQGFIPLELREEKEKQFSQHQWWRKVRYSPAELTTIVRGLSQLLVSGLPLLESLELLSQRISQKGLKEKIDQIQKSVSSGKSLKDSLAQVPSLAMPVAINMIHAGEVSGTLDRVLDDLATMLEEEQDLKAKFQAALHYPLFMLSVGIASIVLLMTVVVPKIILLFEDVGQELPWLTKTLVTVSQWSSSYGGWLLLAVALLWGGYRWFLPQTKWNEWKDWLLLSIPRVNSLVIQRGFAQWSYTLSRLIASGVPFVEALEVASSVVGNERIKKQMQRVADQVRKGESITEGLRQVEGIIPNVVTLVAIGEESGQLEQMLSRVADQLHQEVDRSIKSLVSLLEPILILALGLIVGLMVMAMLLPIFELNLGV